MASHDLTLRPGDSVALTVHGAKGASLLRIAIQPSGEASMSWSAPPSAVAAADEPLEEALEEPAAEDFGGTLTAEEAAGEDAADLEAVGLGELDTEEPAAEADSFETEEEAANFEPLDSVEEPGFELETEEATASELDAAGFGEDVIEEATGEASGEITDDLAEEGGELEALSLDEEPSLETEEVTEEVSEEISEETVEEGGTPELEALSLDGEPDFGDVLGDESSESAVGGEPSFDDILDADGEEEEEPAAPPAKKAAAAASTPSNSDTLPAWNGRARDYVPAEKREAAKPAAPAGKGKPAAAPAKAAAPTAKSPAPAKPTVKLPGGAAAKPAAPAAAAPGKKPTKTLPKPAAAPAKKPAAEAGSGNCSLFLSPPKTQAKKEAAATIIAEVRGISEDEALELTGKMIVPVLKDVDEDQANEVLERLKAAGLSGRITKKR